MDAAVRAILAAELHMAKDAEWAAKIAPRVRTTPEEIKSATSSVEFRIGFTPRFVDDLVKHAEWAIAAGIAKRPQQDLRTLFRGLIHVDATRRVLPDRVTIA